VTAPSRAARPVVIGVGAVAVDELVYVDQPYSVGKGRVILRRTSYGGNVPTALAVVSSLGGHARFAGYLPDATEWADVHADLVALGVDTSDATIAPGKPPIRSTILVTPDGERFVAFDDNTAAGASETMDLSMVASADALLVDSYGAVSALRAVQIARANGVPVVGDLERPGLPGLEELQAAISHLVVPWSFAAKATAETSPEAAIDLLWNDQRAAVVVTDGRLGAWFKDRRGGDVYHVPAFDVDVVDTNGCGDVFHGAYAHAVGTGRPIDQAVTRATAAAALCATGQGGRGRLPIESDMQELLDKRVESPHRRQNGSGR
jgi:sulfofructose kinase